MRNFLVAGEVALSVSLLVSAALMIQSLYRLHREQLGFSPAGVMTFWTPAPKVKNFDSTALERIRALPGVRSAAAVNILPLVDRNNYPTEREGHPEQDIGAMEIRVVTPGYFETMGIPILRGRPPLDTGRNGAPPVILVSETVARQWRPNGNPLGDRVKVGRFRGKDLGKDPLREVVGVVGDTRRLELKEPFRPTVYIPAGQWETEGMYWVVRGNLSKGFEEQLRQAIAGIDPSQRVARLRTMDEIVSSKAADPRFNAWLFGIFAALALALTATGVYGLLSFYVARRTSEIGTRMALGATRADVIGLVLNQGIRLVAIGLAVGLAGAFILTRSLSKLLFGVRPTDPLSYVAVSIVSLAVGMLASYLPARRAANADPMTALRSE